MLQHPYPYHPHLSLLSPEHQAEVKPLLPHQVTSEPVRGRVGQEDDALGEAVAGAVHVGLLQGRLVRGVQLGLVHVHKIPLLPQTCDGADVVQSLARNLQMKSQRSQMVEAAADSYVFLMCEEG